MPICREGQARYGLPRTVEQVALTVLLRTEQHHRTSGTEGNRPNEEGGEYTVHPTVCLTVQAEQRLELL